LGQLVGLGSKFNGFKPKNISKKPIIHLKQFCKSSGQGFKVVFFFFFYFFFFFFQIFPSAQSLWRGSSVLAGTFGASDEISSPMILTEEGFGLVPVDGLVLGLPEVGFEMFSKDHGLGNEVLVSIARDGLVAVSFGPSPSTSLLEQESATVSLEASLKFEGSALAPVHLFPGGSSSGAVELGERLRLSCPVAFTSKPFQKYYRKAREGRVVKMDERLFSDSVAVMRLDFTDGIHFPLSGATLEPELPLESKLVGV